MNDNPHTLRRLSIICAVSALLPMLQQLPWLIIGLMASILLISSVLIKPPHKVVLLLLLALSLVLLMFEYNGRFGRDLATSMLGLMLCLKCLEIHKLRDFRSVLGFSLFLPFASLLSDQSLTSMVLALLSVMAWVWLLQRSYLGYFIKSTDSLPQQLLRLLKQLLLAVPLAMALFWLFPRISTPLWGLPNLANQGTGLGDSMTPGQWLDSLVDDRIAFRVDFDAATPEPNQRYWRGPVLWDFNGETWSRTLQDTFSKSVPLIIPTTKSKAISYKVSLEPTEKNYLPVLDFPESAPLNGYLSLEQTAYVSQTIQKVTLYSARSALSTTIPQTLDRNSMQRALAFPQALNPRTQQLALQWRAQAKNEREYINRVLQWITKDFSYTLATEPPSLNSVDDFLFDQKKGFCQHFSSSFAVLMRAAGIPSRIVTGYVGGYKNPYGNYWVLYQKDAHAWNEVWLADEGWVRVDPTAAVAPENILDTLNDSAGNEQYYGERSVFSPILDYSDFIKSAWNQTVLGFNSARQESLLQKFGIEKTQQWQLLGILVFSATILSLLVFYVFNRKIIAKQNPVEQAWSRIINQCERAGYPKQQHETAIDFSQRQAGKAEWSNDLLNIGKRYTHWRYAKLELDNLATQQLITDMQNLSKKMVPPTRY